MKCDSVEKYPKNPGELTGESIELSAVYSEDKTTENYSYSLATPTARLTIFITNPTAFGAFEQGKEYYIDSTPA